MCSGSAVLLLFAFRKRPHMRIPETLEIVFAPCSPATFQRPVPFVCVIYTLCRCRRRCRRPHLLLLPWQIGFSRGRGRVRVSERERQRPTVRSFCHRHTTALMCGAARIVDLLFMHRIHVEGRTTVVDDGERPADRGEVRGRGFSSRETLPSRMHKHNSIDGDPEIQ